MKLFKSSTSVFFLLILTLVAFFIGQALSKNRIFLLDNSYAAAESCLKPGAEQRQEICLNELLIRTTERKGIRAALDVIEPLSQKYSYLLKWSHPFSHTIGNNSLKYYTKADLSLESKIGRALVECDGFGAFGCYHGVIETGLSQLPVQERANAIRKSCLEDSLIRQKQYFVNQCLHWFGHGVAIFSNLSLKEALAMCEGVGDNFNSDEVQLCLSGLFHAGAVPGESDDELLGNVANVRKEGDPYYPCQEIAERFRGHCYSHSSGRTYSADLTINFKTCDNIPEPNPIKKNDYVRRCYDSAANTLLAGALDSNLDDGQKMERVINDCKRYSSSEYRRFCYAGAARYWVLRDPLLNNLNPFSLCKSVEEEAKPVCYGAIGFGNNENYYSKDKISAYCSNSESKYINDCLGRNY